jgi:hypothetical protein
MSEIDEVYAYERHDGYGNPNSLLLKEIRKAGFKPIGITCMVCEETFIFKGDDEAKAAFKIFSPEGWWYGFGEFIDAYNDYCKKLGTDEDLYPTVYWFDHNFAPKYEKSNSVLA